jgi:hypothetical protein
MVLIFVMPLFQTEQTTYIEFKDASVYFRDSDALFVLHYELTPAARAYILAFGTVSLEPKILRVFASFDDVEVISIKPEVSKVLVRNLSKPSENYYLHHSVQLPLTLETLEVYTPNSPIPRRYHNVNSTPNIFYPRE